MSKIFNEENQLILRVPEHLADDLHKLFDKEDDKETEMIDITPMITKSGDNEDISQFKFKFGNFESNATLVDLPCIIESQKSADSINFFKSNDISQMVYVHPNGEEFLEDVPNNEKIAHKTVEYIDEDIKKVRYIARDGITPPTKCIRTRFFRKHFDVPYEEIRKVEDEMNEILKEIKEAKKRSKNVEKVSKTSRGSITIKDQGSNSLKLKLVN